MESQANAFETKDVAVWGMQIPASLGHPLCDRIARECTSIHDPTSVPGVDVPPMRLARLADK